MNNTNNINHTNHFDDTSAACVMNIRGGRRFRGVAAVLLCAALIVGVAGCGNRSGEEDAISAGVDKQEYNAVVDIEEGNKNIYVILKSFNDYWQVVQTGAAQAGEDIGCNVYVGGSLTEAGWMAQQELIEEAMAAEADGIVIAADDSVKLSAVVSKAYQSGIPTVLIDTGVNTEDYDVVFMTDNLLAGGMAAEEMLNQLRQKGVGEEEEVQIAIQVGVSSSQTINERLAGFSQYWTKHAPEGWNILTEVKCNDGEVEKAKECARDFFDEYPSIDGVFGTNNGSTMGFAHVVRERGLKDVVVVGYDFSEEIGALIASEDYWAATVLQRQYEMGYQGVVAAMRLGDGESVDKKFINTGVVIVNKDTLDDPQVQVILEQN